MDRLQIDRRIKYWSERIANPCNPLSVQEALILFEAELDGAKG